MGYYCSQVCTLKKAIKNFKLKVDVQKGPLRFRRMLIIDVLVSSNAHEYIQMMCLLGLYYYELYPMDEEMFNDFLIRK